MRVYLASRYTRRLEMRDKAIEIEAMGHAITSRWLDGEYQLDGAFAEAARAYEDRGEMHPAAVDFALADVADIRGSDLVLTFTERPREPNNARGGRHVEFGLAYALGKPIVIVGYQENVFHLLPGVTFFRSWSAAKEYMSRLSVLVTS